MNALEARKRGGGGGGGGSSSSSVAAAAGGLEPVEDQYEKFHEFVLGLADVYREELSLLEFLLFVVVFFELGADAQTRFFTRWSDVHRARHPFEVDALYGARRNELKSKLLGETLRFKVSHAAKDLLSDFRVRHPQLNNLITKNFSVDSDANMAGFAPSEGLAALISESERLVTAENALDVVRKQETVRWGVNRRMRAFLMGPGNPLPPNPVAKLDSGVDWEPQTTSAFYKSYVDKLIPAGPESAPSPAEEDAKRVKVSEKDYVEAWPSIAFMTFSDAASNLCSVTSSVSDAGRCVVAGFEDSTARVYMGDAAQHLLVGHSQPVYSAATFQGHVLTASGDGQARLWGPLGGSYRNKAVFGPTNGAPLFACAMSPFGHLFATGGRGGTVRLWVSDQIKEPVRGLAGAHLGDVTALTFHPNAHYVLSGGTDRTVRIWDVNSAKAARTMIGVTAGVECIECDPSGRYAAVGDAKGLIFIYDCGSGKRIRTIEPMAWNKGKKPVLSLSWSADGAFLAAGCASNVSVFSTNVCYGGEEESSTEWLYRTYRTKTDPVLHVNFLRPDVLFAAGIAQSA